MACMFMVTVTLAWPSSPAIVPRQHKVTHLMHHRAGRNHLHQVVGSCGIFILVDRLIY